MDRPTEFHPSRAPRYPFGKTEPTKPIITSARNATSALKFAQGIRKHWGIENRLHWGGVSAGEVSPLSVPPFKDVILGEDAAPFKDYNAATNWSLIRTIAINIARMCGYDSLTKAERILAHDIDKLFYLVE